MQDDAAKRWDDSLISLGLGALVVVVSGILIYNFFSGQTPQLLKKTQTQVIASDAPIAQVASSPSIAPSQTSQATSVAVAKVSPSASAKATVAPTPRVTSAPTAVVKASATPQIAASATPSAVAQASSSGKTLPTKHTVVAGDSFWKIATQYYGSGYEWHRIADANKVAATTGLKVGAEIEVPRAELISATSTVKPSATQIAQASNAPSTTPKASTIAQASPVASTTPTTVAQAPQNPSAVADTSSKTYTVVSGDSVWKIAKSQCNNPYMWSSIARQNKLVNPSVIHSGNTLTFSCTL